MCVLYKQKGTQVPGSAIYTELGASSQSVSATGCHLSLQSGVKEPNGFSYF